MESNAEQRAKRFRNRFFIWSILFIVLVLLFDLVRVEFIMEFNSPIISSNDPKDLEVFEKWRGISFPEGSILRKMQYSPGFLDQSSASILVSIPRNELKQFENDLPKEYALQEKYYDYVDEYEVEGTWDFLRIYKTENGDSLIVIAKEKPSAKVRNLIYENIRKSNFCLTPHDAQATSPDGKYTVRLSLQDFILSADLKENLGDDAWRSTGVLMAVYDSQPIKVEWISNDSFVICGHKKNLSDYIDGLNNSPIIGELD